jgi:DNA-binding response OmpR family regulator
MYKIALVEDDSELGLIISKMLTRYQYDVEVIKNFKNVTERLLQLTPDVVLLDVNLPYMDGFHVCRQVRQKSNVPIIMISARNTDVDQILGIELGADDYVVKPFSMEVLHSKIKACIRRSYGELIVEKNNHILGEFTLDHNSFTILFQEKKVELSKNEYKILKFFLNRINVIVSREDLLNELWDDVAFIDNNTLNVNISRIKYKLNEIGVSDAIITKRGFGYMFIPSWLEKEE